MYHHSMCFSLHTESMKNTCERPIDNDWTCRSMLTVWNSIHRSHHHSRYFPLSSASGCVSSCFGGMKVRPWTGWSTSPWLRTPASRNDIWRGPKKRPCDMMKHDQVRLQSQVKWTQLFTRYRNVQSGNCMTRTLPLPYSHRTLRKRTHHTVRYLCIVQSGNWISRIIDAGMSCIFQL